MDESLIAENLGELRLRIENRCRSNRIEPSSVTILGVTKFIPAEAAAVAVKLGLADLGENRVQEAAIKIAKVTPRPRWHLIGHLQKNKVKKAVEIFDVIESVDSLELAESVSSRAEEMGKRMEIFLQVNSSGEPTKHGFDPGEIQGFADKINELRGLKLSGLMTMGPLTEDIDLIKKSFELTRSVFEKIGKSVGTGFSRLSMGMSGDYELAIDYGTNEIRIGTAIFGYRPITK
ncbi:MAG: YggS family pyridoxal phosphate-dependent enzyme [candidate division Zixibacteria bacterium]